MGTDVAPTEDSRVELANYLRDLLLDESVPLTEILPLAKDLSKVAPEIYRSTRRTLQESGHPAGRHPRLMEMLARIGP